MTVKRKSARHVRGSRAFSRRLLCGASLAAVVAVGVPSVAHAEDRYWDVNGTAVGSGGTGSWDITSPTWSPNGDGVSGPYTPWNNGNLDSAIFGGPNGTNATVTLVTPITVRNITVDTGANYTLTGGTLTLAGVTPTITTNGNAAISSILAGNAGLTKAGAGVLTLTGANSFSGGVNVTAGTLSVSGDSALGAASNGINLSSGSVFRSTGALASSRVVTLLSGTTGIGGGVGSAHLTGAGGVSLVAQTGFDDDTNDFTGAVSTDGFNLFFTSIRNLGEASALGAANTVANGSVFVRNASAVYVGDGDTSNRSWNMAPQTSSSALRNSGTGTLTVTGDIAAGGGFASSVILDAQTADLELLGVISSNLTGFANRPFIFTGGGTNRTITLNNANTFGGAATIQTVTVRVNSLADQGTVSSLGTGVDAGIISLNTGTLSYVGTGSSTNRGFFVNGASSILSDGTGALNLSGAVTFNPANPGDTLTLGGSFAGSNTLSGVISGNGSLVMNGAAGSSWLLSGANTYVGSTTVNSGTLQAGSGQAFGAPNAMIVNGGTLDLNNNDIQVTTLAGTGGSVALSGANLTVNGATSTSYAGSLTGSGGLAKRGTGTLTLSGQSSYTGDTTINGGTLALNFAAAGAPATDILSGASTLSLTGGALTLTGAAGAANSQSFDGLNVGVGNNRIALTAGAGGSMTLNLGALNHTGGLLDFAISAGSDILTSSGDGALGWATINGTDYAEVDGGRIVAFTAYAEKDNASTWLTGDVVADTGGAANTAFGNSVAGNVQLGGLKYTAAAASTVTVGAGNTLGVDGTIIVASSINNASQAITGGSITGAAGGGTLGVLHNGIGTGTFTIASTVVDNGAATSFAKGGTGKVALTGTNSYSGGTTISGGTLAIDSVANGGVASSIGASSSASANLVIESGTLQYTGVGAGTTDRGFTLANGGPSRIIQVDSGNLSFGGVVVGSDDAGFEKTGAGTLTLANGANTYTGVTTISGGTLSVGTLANGGAASGIGASSSDAANLVIQSGGVLQYTGATATTNRSITINRTAGGTIDVANAATALTVSGNIVSADFAPLRKAGAGTLVLSGTNDYAGATFIDGGTLQAGSTQAFGRGNVMTLADVAGVTLDLNGRNNKVGGLSGGGANGGIVRLGGATLTIGGSNVSFGGVITGAGGLTKENSSTQTLLGCNNNYTGATNIIAGTLSVDCLANGGQASGIGASTSAAANLGLNNGVLAYTGGSVTIDRGITLANTGAVNVANAATVLGISGPIVGGSLRKDGAGTLVLSGNNSYTGLTTITGGILRAGSNNAIGRGGFGLNDTAGVVLDLNNFNTAIGFLNGGGATGGNVTLGTATLTIAANAGVGGYAGAISGSGGLIKGGTFTQALTGCGSSYTGSTEVRGGILQVRCLTDGGTNSAIGASSNAAGNLIISGGTLQYVGTGGSTDRLFTLGASANSRLEASGTGAIAFTNAGAIAFATPNTAQTIALGGTNTGNNSLAAQLTNNGAGITSLTKDGAGTWILNNPNSNYTGITTINGGVLGVSKLSNGGVASSIGASTAAAANLVIGNGSTLRYTGTGDTTNRLFTLSAGTTFIESSGTGAVVFTDTGPVTLAGANLGRTIALGGTNAGNNTLAGSIGNAGTGVTVLAKNDAGTWLLTGNNSYTGNTNINAGTLILGNGGTTGSIASATVNNLGTLGFNRSDTLTLASAIGGTGAVNQIGTGSTILTGTSGYTGATTVSAGDLVLQSGGKITATAGLTVSNGGEMVVDGAGSQLVVTGASAVGSTNVGNSALTVRNGGSASLNVLNLATAINSNATLNIIGAGSQLTTSANAAFGTTGTATVNILGGGAMTSSSPSTLVGGQLPTNAQALVTVSGTGSRWNVAGALNARRGTITVADGGVISADSAVIGFTGAGLNNPAMAVTVTGANSRLETTGGLALLNGGGAGALTIADGGVVDVGSGTLAMGGTGQATLNIGAASGNAAVAAGTLDATSVTTTATSTITFNHTDPGLVFAAAISGAGHVDQLSGTTILTGSNSYTGGTVIGGGTLQLGNGGTSGMIAGDVTNDGTLAFNRSNNVVFGGVISGTGSVHQMGPGTLALSGANSYVGGTTISGGGTLSITSDANLGDAAGGVTFDNGTLQVFAPIVTNRDITLAGNGTIDVNTSFDAGTTLTIAGDITGPGSLTKTGIGVLTLTGDATHTGITTVSRGGLRIGNGGTTGSIAGDIVNNTSVQFNRSDSYSYGGSMTGSGSLSVDTGILTLTGNSSIGGGITAQPGGEIRITAGNTVTSGATANANGGTLTVAGAGSTLVAQRVQISTNAGAATVNVENGGTIRTTVAGLAMSPTGAAGPSTLNVSGAGSLLDLASGLTASVNNVAATSNITISNGGTVRSTGANGIGRAAGNTTASTVTITGAGSNWTSTGTLTVNNGNFSVLGGGAASFASATFGAAPQAANLLLSDANSAFTTTGDLVVGTGAGTGVITLADAAELTVGGTFTLANAAGATGVLNIGGAEGQAADAAGFLDAPALTFGPGTGRLNFNHTEANYAFATTMSGAGTINQVAGVTNLTGNSAAFAGTTNVSGGTLRVNGLLGNTASITNVLSGGTLGGGGTIGGNVSIADGGILAPGNSPGTLTIGGDLALSSGSILNFEFGQANTVGGALNDLVNVGGNLTLDGTLNVTEPAGGTFGPGIYRVFNYNGALTNNGLDLGAMPAGSTVLVQTSVTGQVNLVNTAGLALSFWDGAAGPKFDNVINGGTGTWHLAGADANWTDASGVVNDAWSDGTMAIFAGAAGTVTVDNSLGAVTASGMQFATDGYRIDGAPLTLIGPQSTIQVGDGSAAGAGYTATIDAVLGGATQLVKTDLGTLVLTGANAYTGGTAINGGTLQISSNANLGTAGGGISFNGGTLRIAANITSNRNVILAGAGTVDVGNALIWTESGTITGAGSLTKAGAGTMILTGNSTYTGGTTIAGGTLQLGATGVTGSIVGDIVNNGALVFNRTANYSFDGVISGSGSVTQNQGVLNLTADSSYGGSTGVNFAQLRITAGNTVSSGGATGISQGGLTVSGAGSTLQTSSVIAQSGSAVATIDVANGGVIRTTSGGLTLRKTSPAGTSAASLNVSGAGSLVDLAGAVEVAANAANSIANITVSNGGALRSGGSNLIGFAAAGNAVAPTVTITGSGSNWTSTGTLAMTNGNFSLLNGGTASFASATIGSASTVRPASVLVSGPDSVLSTTADLVVGSGAGTGALTLADGGRVDVDGAFVLADNAAATGILNIGGAEGQAAAATGVFDAATLVVGSATSRINFNHTNPDYIFGAVLTGTGSVNQVAGTTTLTGANGYAGVTTVSGGTLLINGDQSASTNATNVNAGTLGGIGIVGGDVFVANGATLAPGDATGPGTLTINGNLALSAGASLAYDFGQSNIVGGPLNDLIDVDGDLTLDGTIDVTVSPGGSFDVGLYRVISYGGALDDQGLALGAMPAGSVVGVQTSIAGQVNLVNSAGAAVNFWDGGDPANKLDGAVNGGDGVWQANAGNINWADITGAFNNGYNDGSFAIFAAAPGTVAVDNGFGQVTASGMQFATDGYTITGQGIALVGPASVIRVGDGTAAGAGYTATIASALTGAGDLAKTDLGTLALTGANSIAGDTYVAAGELRLADGGTLSSVGGYIGRDTGSHGTVTVTGRDGGGNASTWTVTGDFWIGSDGFGTLNIADGGKVISNTGFVGVNSGGGEALVTGAGSSWEVAGTLDVGLFGTGNLRIEDGATVSSGDGIVGDSSRGDAVVTGAGSSWTNAGQLTIGSFATGTLRIEDGASVTSSQGYVGASGDGSVVVTGTGSNWLVTSSTITIGNNTNGSLTIENGGRVRAEGGIRLGSVAGVNGTLTLQGTTANLGILETSGLQADLGTVSVTLDGGLLRATQDNASFFTNFGAQDITLGANGGVIDTDGHDIGISPRFVGAGGLTKDGAGTLTLTGANAYAGATMVNAGRLIVDGDQSAATGLTTVFSGASLGGSGTIGGNVDLRDGGILTPGTSAGTLTINGNLSLAGGSILDYEFGQADVAGGAFNDLVNVGGDLVLDGTINVSVSAGGSFGPGIYRVFNYGGALTDNGLALGTLPGGSQVSVQTAITGQVNLVNTAGLTLSFWDGTIGPKNNGVVNGGDGVWRVDGGSNNWTDANGTINADYAQDSFAIFAGVAGTVTIDNSGGNVLASGMQFASDGYLLIGDGLALTGTQAIIQVGDGSAASAGYTATIGADLTGTARLAKTDAGTLVLSGTNSYTGGTSINGGTLRISADTNLGGATGDLAFNGGTLHTTADIVSGRAVELAGAATFLTDADLTLAGVVSGAGRLTKDGAGSLVLTANNNYAGGTVIAAGTLQLGDGGTSGGILGGVANNGTLTFNRSDSMTFGGAISGSGIVNQIGAGETILTGNNSYTGGTVIADGVLRLGNGGTTGSIAGNVVNDGLLVFDRSDASTFAGLISGTGAVNQAGTGTTILTGNSNFTGGTTIAAGVLQLGDGGTTGAIIGDVANFGLLAFDRSDDVTFAGLISGTGGLAQNGAGILTMTGANSYAGATMVNAGTLRIDGDQSAATGLTTVFSGATLGGSGIVGGNVDVLGGATLAPGTGPGTLTINGDLSLAGGSILAFEFGQANVAGGALNDLVNVGGDLVLDGTINVSVPAGGSLGPGIYRVFNYGGTLTNNGLLLGAMPGGSAAEVQTAIAGQVNLVNTAGLTLSFWDGTVGPKNNGAVNGGDGVWRVDGSSSNWTDLAGAVNANYAQNSFAIFSATSGTVTVDNVGGNVLASGMQFASDGYVLNGDMLTLTGAQAIIQVGDGSAASAGYTATIGAELGGTARLVKTDAGTLVLTGTNSYTGGTSIGGGTLRIASDASLGDAAGGLSLDGGTLNTTADVMSSRVIDLVGAGSFLTDAGTSLTLAGTISGGGRLDKTGNGTLVLTGGNSYAGGTTIAAGTLQIGAGGTSGGIAGDVLNDGTLAFNRSDDVNFAGSISGSGGIELLGAGTTVLTGANGYAGATNVRAGTLLVNGDQSGATGLTSVASGATLGGVGTIGGGVTIADGGVLAAGNNGVGTLAISGDLALGGGSRLAVEFGAANVPGGPLNDLVNVDGDLTLDGTIDVAVAAGGDFGPGVYRVINYGGTLTDNGLGVGTLPGGSAAFVQTVIAGQVNLVNTAGLTLNIWDGTAGPKNDGAIGGGDGVWRVGGGSNNWTETNGAVNADYAQGSFAIFQAAPGTVTVDDAGGNVLSAGMQFASDGYVVAGDALTLTGADARIRVGDGSVAEAGYTATIDADLTGTARLVKDMGGTLILSGNNSYTGGTAIDGGTLRISSDANLGDASGALSIDGGTLHTTADITSGRAVALVGDATFRTDTGTTLSVGGTVSGAGGLTKDGLGTLLLAADAGYTGGTTIRAGVLQLGDGGTGGSIAGDVANDGVLAFNRSDDVVFAGAITGSGALQQLGAGTVILTEANSYTGGTSIAAGTLQLGNGGSTGSIAGNVSNNGTLAFNRSDDITFGGLISGTGGVDHLGTGTTILTAANSYTGATNILAGTVLVNGDQSAATGLVHVASGATLGGIGRLGGNVAVADGGALAPGAGGPGALTMGGNLTLASGATLGFEFGQANNPGGALNDVVNVGGDLVLDGTIDIAVASGGSLDIGLYRVINYGGALTNNGLVLGTMPAGGDLQVQTSIGGQVNLINTGSATLNFWDGAAGPKFDGAVNGGNGVWQGSTGNDNWADVGGTVNAGYADGAFAIFSGTAGTVTIDNSLGAVSASGLQFATDGYRITGQALTLAGPQAVVRVGDGTAAGQAYVTTIDAEVAGSAQLVKTDAGTLVFEGTNSYTGGTLINGGTIRISADANLGDATGGLGFDGGALHTVASFASDRDVDLIGSGTFVADAGTTLTLTGAITGAGNLVKSGAGTLALGGSGTFGGGTTVSAGTLFVNGDYSGATGATNVASGATLGGTGSIGGDVIFAGGATLAPGAGAPGTLTVGGNLSLAAGSRLDFELGDANAAGGALNDLVNVGGNLTLDGTIDVGVPAGGAFDVGVYRLFNYGGSLTDNGLTLGTIPAGAAVAVQTSVAGQVNLVNSAGLTLNFWDGAAGPKNNGVINGGDGVWQNSTGNDNWTEASGAVNAPYSDGAFAIFGGTAGTVTVDDGLGAVSVAGMQFAANGYVVTGDALSLTGAQTTIRVGDGSTAGTGFTATINSVLGGATQIVKTDAGTLVLGAANSYTGGTLVTGGTVQIASDANLGAAAGNVTLGGGTLATSADLASSREIAIAGLGTIATADATTFTFSGRLSGTGDLTKAGLGTLFITGNNDSFAGSTTVTAGTLAVQGSLGGAMSVGTAGRLEGAGRVGSLVNSGVVAPGSSIGTLTVAGNYSGAGGTLEIEAELGGDASAADRLVVNGATSGNTAVTVINGGGLGAQTVEGIKIVDVAGASNGNFTLDGDYLFGGQQAVIAGAYGYRLYKNGVATPQDGDWYLRSSLLNPAEPENPGPLYQPGVPVYESYVDALQALNGLPTMQQRVGNRSWAGTPTTAGTGIWGRIDSRRERPEAIFSTSNAERKTDSWQAQMGADAILAQRGDGATLVGGINGHYGKADTGVTSIFGNGSIDTKAYGVGATLTWYGPKGFYVDGQAKLSWFESDLESNILGTLAKGNDGTGQAYSVEAGKRSQIGQNLTVTPQIQMTYTEVDFDRFADPAEAAISVGKGNSLKTRWGLSIDHQKSWAGASGGGRRTHFYATINLAYEWLDGARVDVSATPIETRERRLWGEMGIGGSYSWGGDRFTLYTEVSGDTPVTDFGEGYSLKGVAGLRMRF